MIGPNLQRGKQLAHRHPIISGRARPGDGWMDAVPSPGTLPWACSVCQGPGASLRARKVRG